MNFINQAVNSVSLSVPADSFQFHSALVKLKDNRGWLSCIQDIFSATVKELSSRWQRQYNPLKGNARDLFPTLQSDSNTYAIDEKQWRNSSRLIVLIHGLNSSPLAWTNYLEEISKFEDQASCFVPYVLKKGYCKCKEAARPILDVVQKYADQYPDNPIFLVGHSNGARIAAYIEQKLNADDIRVVSIAGPHCGSKLVSWLSMLRLAGLFGMPDDLVEELAYEGQWAVNKLKKWQEQQGTDIKRKVERVFFASADDWRIFPANTCFPRLPNSSYYLMSGESHVTIIDAVRPKVLGLLKGNVA